MRLLDLGFSDLFVGPNLDWSWYRATSNSPECRPIPPEAANELDRFRAHLLALGDVQDERTNWDNEPLRIKRKLIDNGVVLYVIRRFKLDEYSMSSVRLQTSLAKELLSASKFFDSGAIAVFGPPGGGKTSTALSIVLDRLRHYGGTAWRLGCPIEVPMQGKHGKGWLYELNLKRDEQIADEIRELYRTVPKIVMVEEVRDGKTAREVVRAAGSGYLVAFAMHANDLVSGIGQFVRWAAQDDFEETASRVADFMRVAMYVELHSVPVGANVKRSSLVADEEGLETALIAQPLFFTEKDAALRSMVRSGEFHRLADGVSRQRRMLMAGEPLVE